MRILAFVPAITLLAGAPAASPAPSVRERWVGTWAAAPQPPLPDDIAHFQDQSLRLIVHVSIGGRVVRLRLSNAYGKTPLVVGAARVARRSAGADITPGSDRKVAFGGASGVIVPPGAEVVSDPVPLDVAPLSDLAVSLFLPAQTSATTTHILAQQTSYVAAAAGNVTDATQWPGGRALPSWPFLAGIDVRAAAGAVVAFGDSLVDGDGSTPDSNRRWPDRLAARLRAAGRLEGVLNEGLIGNRLLRGSPALSAKTFGSALGEAGIVRFRRDALGRPGTVCIIVRIGSNDIGFPGALAAPAEMPTAADLIEGYGRLIAAAHRRGIRIVGTTIPPFEGATLAPGLFTPAKETLRRTINRWILDGRRFDAVIDFDAVLRDFAHPSRLAPKFDSGDHLHPNDAGYAAMAAAIPLSALGMAGS